MGLVQTCEKGVLKRGEKRPKEAVLSSFDGKYQSRGPGTLIPAVLKSSSQKGGKEAFPLENRRGEVSQGPGNDENGQKTS